MTKKLKILALICVMGICGAFLSSCEYIDDLRSERAVYIQEDGETKILKDGKIYVELVGVRLQLDYLAIENGGYVAEADVPILLVKQIGDPYYDISNKSELIEARGRIYCSEDMYDYYIGYYEREYLDSVCVKVFNQDKQEWVYRMFEEEEAEVIYSAKENKLASREYTELPDSLYKDSFEILLTSKGCSFFSRDKFRLARDNNGNHMLIATHYDDEENINTYTVYDIPRVSSNKRWISSIYDEYYKLVQESVVPQ